MRVILHYITSLYFWKGGVESFVINTYAGLDKDLYRFEILTRYFEPDTSLARELAQNGIKVHSLQVQHLNSLKAMVLFYNRLCSFFKDNQGRFAFIHSHRIDEPFVLQIAKRYGITQSAVHVHAFVKEKNNTGIMGLGKMFFQKRNINDAKYKITCSDLAGKYIYGNTDYIVVKNTIITDHYKYDATKRMRIRKQYNLDSKQVFGFVGRLADVKNIPFLMEVFSAFEGDNKVLIIVGDGERKESLIQYAKELDIEHQVIFVGAQTDVCAYLSAMDVFIQPSLSEGFPFTLLEAQCNGLISFGSDMIPDEIALTELYHALPLSAGAFFWAKEIHNVLTKKAYKERSEYSRIIIDNGFDTRYTGEYICKECYLK